jgi:hypothetical protein
MLGKPYRNRSFRITETGQLVLTEAVESVVIDSAEVLQNLLNMHDHAADEKETTTNPEGFTSYYGLGSNVSAFVRELLQGEGFETYASIRLHNIPFYTQWEVSEGDGRNSGRPILFPAGHESDEVHDFGNALTLPVPDDLIVMLTTRFKTTINPITAHPAHLPALPAHLTKGRKRTFLTAFSLTRNTAVQLPLPNLYDDCHLCMGSSLHASPEYNRNINWDSIPNVMLFISRVWGTSAWNLDLLGEGSDRLRDYQEFVSFDLDTLKALPFAGCSKWPRATSPAPLMQIYAPWFRENEKPKSARKAPRTPPVEPVLTAEEQPIAERQVNNGEI